MNAHHAHSDHHGHEDHEPPKEDHSSTTGRVIHFNSAESENGVVSGTRNDDIIFASTDGRPHNQIHLYAGAGNDKIHLDIGIQGGRNNMHGHHAYGGDGNDKFIFTNAHDLRGTIVGRLDDFDDRSDTIWVGDKQVDLSRPQVIDRIEARVVLYQDQQWIELRNEHGGRALYTLEPARRLPDDSREEPHFLAWNHDIPKDLPVVSYTNPMERLDQESIAGFEADHIIRMGDNQRAPYEVHGKDGKNMIQTHRGDDTIHGGDSDDLIRASWGNDIIHTGDGNNLVDAGKGHDTIFGGSGNDIIYGGPDNDVIHAGGGDNFLYGGSGNDIIYGGTGNDYIHSGKGDDILYGGPGGVNTIVAVGTRAMATGGPGQNTYQVGAKTVLTITDFDVSKDSLDISAHFEDLEDMLEFVFSTENSENPDLIDLMIEMPDGGSIKLIGQGDLIDNPALLVHGWEDQTPPESWLMPPDRDDNGIDDGNDDVNDGSDIDDGGMDFGFLLLAGLLGGLLMIAMQGGG